MSDKYLHSEEHTLLNSIGTELCWGWSPAIAFTEVIPLDALSRLLGRDTTTSENTASAATAESPTIACPQRKVVDELDALLASTTVSASASPAAVLHDERGVHILLAGACDIRHIFRTLSSVKILLAQEAEKARAAADASDSPAGSPSKPATTHFYLYEPNLRVHARHIFFLQWLCDSLFSFDKLEDQVAMFLEVFGNALLRDITAAQVKDVAGRALRTIGHEEGLLAQTLDFTFMKAKERDFVEDQIRHWTKSTSQAHIEKHWNHRLRTEMAERYDNKDNIIDWDFNFHLYEYTNAIKFPEYRTWRNSGVAFDYCHVNPRKGFQYEYNVPNKTLCHFDRRGNGLFNGDIKSGPFFSIGIDTRNPHLHPRNADGTLKYGNGVTAMHNVRAWLYELMCGKEWPWASHAFAWDDPANYNYLPPGTPNHVEHHAELPPVRFHIVGLDFDRFLLHLKEGKNFPKFDAAFVGSNSAHVMTPKLFEQMKADAPVVCETAKFIVDCKDEAKARFQEKLKEMGASAGWEVDRGATAFLHKDQPEPRKGELEVTDAQRRSAERLQDTYVLVLKRKK